MTEAEWKQKVRERLNPAKELGDEEIREAIDQVLLTEGHRAGLAVSEKLRLRKRLFDALRRLDILQELVEDEDVTEIMVNGRSHIFIERDGQLAQYEGTFSSQEVLEDVIQQIVSRVNRAVNTASPIVDARLPDGSRVNVVLPPVAPDGPILTIRKFPREAITMEKLIAWGSITPEAAEFLAILVRCGYNLFISGGTGSGKTTFLNALSAFIPEQERIITIEDSLELQIKSIPNLVRLETRNADAEGNGAVTIRDLIRTSLRMRPTRIIVGETRGAEALDMLQAFNTGHDGSLSTAHANSPRDLIARLETMVLMAGELPLAAIRQQIASSLEILVHLGRLRGGKRKVLEIVEVLGYDEGEIRLQTLFSYSETLGRLLPAGRGLVRTRKLELAGERGKRDRLQALLSLPRAMGEVCPDGGGPGCGDRPAVLPQPYPGTDPGPGGGGGLPSVHADRAGGEAP